MAKKFHKRKTRKFRRKKVYKDTLNRGMVTLGLGFPKKVLCTHRYRDIIQQQTTTGVPQKYFFSCNNMFDPDTTGGGHQALYFDQLSAIYNHYVCIASKITVRITPSVSSTTPLVCAAFINDDTSATTSFPNAFSEQSSGKRIQMISPNANNGAHFVMKWSAKKYFGRGVLSNTDLQGTPSTAPAEQSYYCVIVEAADAGSTINSYVDYEVEYICVWKELKDIAQS